MLQPRRGARPSGARLLRSRADALASWVDPGRIINEITMDLRTTLWASALFVLAFGTAADAAPQAAPNPENYEIEVGNAVGGSGGVACA